MSLNNAEIKQQVGETATNIYNDIRCTLSPGVYERPWNDIGARDNNKLGLMRYVREYSDELYQAKQDTIVGLMKVDQLESMKKLIFFTHPNQKRADGKTGVDYFDLEKSFQAYHLFYSSEKVRPLSNIGYSTFQDVRKTRLHLFGKNFKGPVYSDEVKKLSDDVEQLCDRADTYVRKHGALSSMQKRKYVTQIETMKENSRQIYGNLNTALICGHKDEDDENQGYEDQFDAVLALGYGGFALGHLTEDENILFEKRYFLVEQTSRVLHHLAHNG